VILVVLAGPYFVPSIVAFSRKVRPRAGIALLNLFLGWTVLGWIGALIWACVAETESQAQTRELAYRQMAQQDDGSHR
jgi:hypothetical protein